MLQGVHVDARITSAEGNEINNSAYDADKFGKTEIEIAVSLKHLSNFWRALKMSLINFEVSLILTWSREYIITQLAKLRYNGVTINKPLPNYYEFFVPICIVFIT